MGKMEFSHIDKIYPNGFQAVYDFNLSIENGEFVVLVGPSGCGKSTLLRMIAGLEGISKGELSIDGKIINKLPPVDRDISVVFQDYALYGNMSVYDNVGMSLKVRHRRSDEIFEKVIETSRFLEIQDYLNRYPDQLSGGQKQRVSLGRAIARAPKVYLMDEPLSNLDAKLRTHTRTEIVRVQRKLGVTTVYVTHDQVEAMTMADKIVVMSKGVIQQVGSPMEIYQHPNNLFVAGFIGTPPMNFISGKLKDGNLVGDDFSIVLPDSVSEKLSSYEDKMIVIGIRPEHMFISDTEEGIPMKLEANEFLGNYILGFFQMGKTQITAKLPCAIDLETKEMNVAFEWSAVHFFDQETTMNISQRGKE